MTDEEMSLWWLSFVDPDKSAPADEQEPGGPGFLGVCIVEALDEVSAVSRAWELGINPGGEVAILGPIPPGVFAPADMNRLLSRDEAMEF